MKRKYWVVSPNAKADGNVDYWLNRSKTENKVFVGYDNDKKHGYTFEKKFKNNDCVIIAQGAKSNRKLSFAGIITSSRFYEDKNEVFFRNADYLIDENDFRINDINLDHNNAWGDSSNPGTIYELKNSNEFDKIVIDKINKLLKLKLESKTMQDKIDLLKYKKQIILQGPPGTGKTRLAKLLAEEITSNNEVELMINTSEIISKKEINIDDIKLNLKIDDRIKSSNGSTSYVIKEINEDNCSIKGDGRDVNDTIVFSTLIKHIKNPNNYPLGTGLNSQYRAVSNFILSKIVEASISSIPDNENFDYKTLANDYIKLIQFHPAYSYEDFVRGITAKSNGYTIEYKTENKLLASFAEIALKNYENSLKDPELISQEQSLENIFDDFIDSVQDEIDKHGKYSLTNSAYIFQIDDDAFKYTGDKWKSAFRIPFTEIMKMYRLNILERKEIKKHHAVITRAKTHATYYFNLLEKFNDFLPETITIETASEVKKNNYVLIIDEINRANLPSVLGELIYALEYRGNKVESMYEIDRDNSLIIPPNLYIIGTMNTSDRSVGHIDYAIRRRFAFVDIFPDIVPIRTAGINKFKAVCELFIEDYDNVDWNDPKFKPSKHLSSEFKPEDVMIGHSYFITKDIDEDGKPTNEDKQIELKLKYEIVPILKEYIKDGILKQSKEVDDLISKL